MTNANCIRSVSRFLAAGLVGALALGGRDSTAAEASFYAWQIRPVNTTASLKGIAYSGSRFLAVGDSHCAVSADGKSWATSWNPVFSPGLATFWDVAYGAGWFIAVGAIKNGEGFATRDGITWDNRTINTPDPVTSVCFAKGHFMATKPYDQALIMSLYSDGSSWSEVYDPAKDLIHDLYDVTYDAEQGYWVAVGACGQVLWSSSGLKNTWSTRVSIYDCAEGSFHGVAAGKRRWVAVGESGLILLKRAGSDWRLLRGPTSEQFNAVAYGEGVFVAVGNKGAMAISANGVRWFPMASGVTQNLNNICYANDRFYVVGDAGTILESAAPAAGQNGVFMDLEPQADGSMRMEYFGPIGSHTLEASSDLREWTTVGSFVSTRSLTTLDDPEASSKPRRMYRVGNN